MHVKCFSLSPPPPPPPHSSSSLGRIVYEDFIGNRQNAEVVPEAHWIPDKLFHHLWSCLIEDLSKRSMLLSYIFIIEGVQSG